MVLGNVLKIASEMKRNGIELKHCYSQMLTTPWRPLRKWNSNQLALTMPNTIWKPMNSN